MPSIRNFLAITLLLGAGASVADDQIDLKALEPSAQFDFLIGSWDYSFAGGCGHSRYWKGPQGNSVLEQLGPGYVGDTPFSGFSVLLHNNENGGWNHNWVDSMGNVLESEGQLIGQPEAYDHAVVQTEFAFQGRTFRHVWYKISASDFYTDLWINAGEGSSEFQMIRTIHFWRSEKPRSFADSCDVISQPGA